MNSELVGKRKTIHSLSALSVNNRQTKNNYIDKEKNDRKISNKTKMTKNKSNDEQVLESYSN